MFLSQLRLEGRSRAVLKDLSSAYELHRTLSRAFPGAADGGMGRVLFRVDTNRRGDEVVVLVQSEKRPDWSRLPGGYTEQTQVRDVSYSAGPAEPLANARATTIVVRAADLLRFRLVANPTVKRDGKRHGLLREEEQLAWLARKGQAGGFALGGGSVVVVPLGDRQSRRPDPQRGVVGLVTHVGVRFDGLLTVVDPVRFVQTLETGVGSAKGFGFGLLSIAPPSEP